MRELPAATLVRGSRQLTWDGRLPQGTRAYAGSYVAHVVVKSADGRTLKSPHVIYSQLQDRISSDTTYEFTAENTVSTGKGFETDLKMTRKVCRADCKVRTLVNVPK